MIVRSVVVVFFFKQKTAYEMRISDWSSDVCSSDLQDLFALAVDHLALGVHDVVVLQDVLASLEVQLLDLPLGALHGPRDHPSRYGLVLGPIGRATCRERVCQSV